MTNLTTQQVTALEAVWQTLSPIPVGDEQYLSIVKLHSAVGDCLFPDGIHDDDQYDHVVQTATTLAHKHGYAGETTLRPPQVGFGQIGTYLRKQPTLDPALLSAQVMGQPITDSYKPVGYYSVESVRNHVLRQLHGTTHVSSPVLNLLDQQIEVAMTAQGWTRTTGSRPRYERPLVPDLDGLQSSLVKWLQTQQRAVSHSDLIRKATTYAFNRAYDVMPTDSAEYKQSFQPILATLPNALRIAKFETMATNGLYQPQPLEISAEMIAQSYAALDALTPTSTKQGDVLLHNDVQRTLAATLGVPQKQLTDLKMQQIRKVLLNHWLQRNRYEIKTTFVRGRNMLPPQREGVTAYVPVCQVVQDVNHQIALGSGKAKAFPVHAPLCIIDEKRNAIVCLQLIGNPQAVKANWARLMTAYQTSVEIDDVYIRQRGMKKHLVFKKLLPLDQVEWVLLHKQASYEAMQPDEPFYVLDNAESDHPAAFFPMLDAALAIPLQPHWANYFWQQGLDHKLIRPVSERAYGKMAWHVNTTTETWEQIIQEGFRQGALVLLHDGDPVDAVESVSKTVDDDIANFGHEESPDNEDGMPELISTYTTDEAMDDGLIYSVDDDLSAAIEAAGLGDMFPKRDSYNIMLPPSTRFSLGRVVTTPGALELAEEGVQLSVSLHRHANADWGEMSPEDIRANNRALKNGNERLFSSYEHTIKTDNGDRTVKLWIITEWDRSVTTLLRPDEY